MVNIKNIPCEHIGIRQAHVGSFCPAKLHALHIKHQTEDVLAKPLDYNLIYSLKQTIISFSSWSKFAPPISAEHLNLHTSQVLLIDRYLPAITKSMRMQF